MFGTDLVGVVAGAAGGGIAAVIWGLVGWRAKSKTAQTLAIVVAFVVGFKVAPNVLRLPIEQAFGRSLRAAQFEATYVSEIEPQFRKYSGIERVFRDFPEKVTELKAAVRETYIARGSRGLLEEGPAIGASIWSSVLSYYIARAVDADLVAVMRARGAILKALQENHSDLCVQFIRGAELSGGVPNQRACRARCSGAANACDERPHLSRLRYSGSS